MLPRPLHRWKSFWLGVFVVVFLGWAWVRSMKYNDGILYGSILGAEFLYLGQSRGDVGFAYGVGIGASPELYVVCIPNEMTLGGDVFKRWFPTAINWDGWKDWRWSISIAHWFLILLFLISWTTWLVWRSRRMKRLAPGSAGLQTGSNRP
jgi:hypothetical protein